jgi:small subunit ribosomal protein S6
MKRYYECTFIVNPGLDDPQIDSVVKSIEDAVTKNGGEIVTREDIGRRRLAYPITKKHNGYYTSLEFEAEPHVIDKMERFLKLDENVMRYLTLSLDPKELEVKRARIALAKQAELERAAQETEKEQGDNPEKSEEKETKSDSES